MNRLDMRCHEYMTYGKDTEQQKLFCYKEAGHTGLHSSDGPDGTVEWNFDDT